MRQVRFAGDFEGWKAAARTALAENIRPDEILWTAEDDAQADLDLTVPQLSPAKSQPASVPREFLRLAGAVALHSDPAKWRLLYSVLWRLSHGENTLLTHPLDPEVIELRRLENQVRKDAYRMTAFARFREVPTDDGPWFVAWYEPEHDTLQCNADFFVGRFANMRWSILTPRRCMHWDGASLSFTAGATRAEAPRHDDVETLWLAYYRNIFNPARLKPAAMQAQLLKRNWKNLPEAVLIEPLLREAPRRTDHMLRTSAGRVSNGHYALATPPDSREIDVLRAAAADCRACPLWQQATCTVFGTGPRNASIMLVGEQPGDQEDRAGRPFVGPAGEVLQSALHAAGINRDELYVTNAVKHFKWEPRGKRRIHQTPNSRDIAACRPWLLAEIQAVQPQLIVCLGATALRSIFDAPLPVTENRGRFLVSPQGIRTLVTVHPSSLLRMPDEARRAVDFQRFVADLARLKEAFSERAG